MTTSRTGTAKWKTLRARLIKSRPHYCHWCSRELDPKSPRGSVNAIEIDHVVPVSVAPQLEHDETNLVLACYGCNRAKGGRGIGTRYAIDVNGLVVRDPSIVCTVHPEIKFSCPHSGSLAEAS